METNNKKPVVLFVMHMPPPVHGASMMGKYIHDSKLVNDAFDCHYINLTTAKGLEDIGKGGIKKFYAFGKKLIAIRKAIKTLKPDCVYVTPNSAGGKFYKDFVVVEWCKRFCKNVILHFHNKGVQTMQERWLDDKLYRKFFNGVKVILLGEGLYLDVQKYVKRENVFVCPNGLPDECSDNSCTQKKDVVPHLFWLTNIMLTKGIMEYLEALSILKKKDVKFVADFVGAATMEMNEEEFQNAVKSYDLEDVVNYAGKRYGKEKEEFFNKADVFVLPSYTEAFPLTILEAMMHRIPVVASNVGGISEEVVHGVNGYLVGGETPIMKNTFKPSPREIAEYLDILINDSELRKNMGEKGYARYQELFTLEAFEKKFVDALVWCQH